MFLSLGLGRSWKLGRLAAVLLVGAIGFQSCSSVSDSFQSDEEPSPASNHEVDVKAEISKISQDLNSNSQYALTQEEINELKSEELLSEAEKSEIEQYRAGGAQ